MQSADKNEIFFVSEHAVETVTNKIQNFKEANKKIYNFFHKGSDRILTIDVAL